MGGSVFSQKITPGNGGDIIISVFGRTQSKVSTVLL